VSTDTPVPAFLPTNTDFGRLLLVPSVRENVCNNSNKKLSYCCDSRSYCMQYFNAIHCDRNVSTSEEKKIRLLSFHGSNNYCGSASAIRSPHTSAAPAVAPFTAPSRQAECHCWQTSRAFSTPSLSP